MKVDSQKNMLLKTRIIKNKNNKLKSISKILKLIVIRLEVKNLSGTSNNLSGRRIIEK